MIDIFSGYTLSDDGTVTHSSGGEIVVAAGLGTMATGGQIVLMGGYGLSTAVAPSLSRASTLDTLA